MSTFRPLAIALLAALPTLAQAYPTNLCVGTKQKQVGKYCKAVLQAWSAWDVSQNAGSRDATIQAAAARLDRQWTAAEARSLAAGSDCADTTLSLAAAESLVEGAVSGLVTAINTGLDLGNPAQASCGAKLLRTAAVKCGKLLQAEGKHVRALEKDPERALLAAGLARASARFSRTWARQAAGCPTAATVGDVETRVDDLHADVVRDTIMSPNVDDTQFTTYSPTGLTSYLGRSFTPICMNSSPYHYFAKRGSVNKLLVYYQGGGACWEQLTCVFPACDRTVDPASTDNPNNAPSGFFDLSDPRNPFRDWNIVFVSYCSCDVHFGDAARDYPLHVEHRGYHNARVVEKFAREHFVDPEVVFVTGSSAGAYGAWFNGAVHHFVWPASRFQVLADAGNGVITADFLQNYFPTWNFTAHLNEPVTIPGVQEAIDDGTGIPAYTEAVASYFPNTRWAHYTSAYDGGTGGQTGFYNIMLNGNNPIAALTWWNGSCAFHDQMRTQALATAAAVPSNYRYYIGTGSRHTTWYFPKVYSDTSGGVPLFVDWVNALLDGTPAWTNVECSPCETLSAGDPRPSPLMPPFEQQGPDVVVDCVGSPSGAFLDGGA